MDCKSFHYPGGKGSSGTYQTIINALPEHDVFIEAFAGSAKITHYKKPASITFLIEKNPVIADMLNSNYQNQNGGNWVMVVNDDFFNFEIKSDAHNRDRLIYFDPPYLHETRKDANLYGRNFELTVQDHIKLLNLILKLNDSGYLILVSHYPNNLYDEALDGFNHFDFRSNTRHGLATERLYFNYEYPVFNKHEYTYAGNNFREREAIKIKVNGYINKFKNMADLERATIINALKSHNLI